MGDGNFTFTVSAVPNAAWTYNYMTCGNFNGDEKDDFIASPFSGQGTYYFMGMSV